MIWLLLPLKVYLTSRTCTLRMVPSAQVSNLSASHSTRLNSVLTPPSPAAGGSDVSVRVISDSPAVAAYARVVLAGSPPRSQRPVVTAYVLTSMSGR